MNYQLRNYKKLNLVIRWLIFLVILNIAFSTVLRLQADVNTSFRNMHNLKLGVKVSGDSWLVMTHALEYLDKNPKTNVYKAMLYNRVAKFQYPPTSLLVFDLPHRMGMSYVKISHWMDRISWICVILFGLVTGRILTRLLKNPQFESFRIITTPETISVYFLVCFLAFLYYPVTNSYYLGQMQTLLTLFGALSLLYWQADKKFLTGIFIGLICLVKPQLAMLLFWAVIRKQWKVLIAAAIVILPCLLVSIWLYGFENHLEYLSVLSFLSHHGEAYFPNQSINGLLNRLFFNGDNLNFNDIGFPPYSRRIYVTTMVFAMLLLLPALFWNYKSKNPDLLDLGILILATTLASPISWQHHYGIIFTVFIILLPFALFYYKKKTGLMLVLSFGFVLTAQYIEFVKNFAHSMLNILQSYTFIGACILLVYLLRISYLQNKKAVVEL